MFRGKTADCLIGDVAGSFRVIGIRAKSIPADGAGFVIASTLAVGGRAGVDTAIVRGGDCDGMNVKLGATARFCRGDSDAAGGESDDDDEASIGDSGEYPLHELLLRWRLVFNNSAPPMRESY
jgi:hypothetical protein